MCCTLHNMLLAWADDAELDLSNPDIDADKDMPILNENQRGVEIRDAMKNYLNETRPEWELGDMRSWAEVMHNGLRGFWLEPSVCLASCNSRTALSFKKVSFNSFCSVGLDSCVQDYVIYNREL